MFSSDLGNLFNNTISSESYTAASDLAISSNITALRGVTLSDVVSVAPSQLSMASTTSISNVQDCTSPGGHLANVQLPPTDSHNIEHLFQSDFHQVFSNIQPLAPPSSKASVVDPGAYPELTKSATADKKFSVEHSDPKQPGTSFSTQPVHSRGSLRCPFCDKVFSNSSAIAKHKLTHSEERKYVCSICHKAFKRQDHLNGHKYTHEAKKPHACHFCDKSYSDARSLRRHYENTHPEEYERWLILSQATNGDPSAITAAAVALLSSSGLVSKKENEGCVDEGTKLGVADGAIVSQLSDTTDPSTLLTALNNPVCKLLASSLTRAASQSRADASPMSHSESQVSGTDSSSALRRGEHKYRSAIPRSDILGGGSPHSPNSGCCSLSSVASPSGTMETTDCDEGDDRSKSSSTIPSLASLTPAEVATATKVALMMVHPLEAPKRVACKVCRKRFKNQSALNGHMRLHGGYGPAGLAAPHTTTSRPSSEEHSGQSDCPSVHSQSGKALPNPRTASSDTIQRDDFVEALSMAFNKQSKETASVVQQNVDHSGSSISGAGWTPPQRGMVSSKLEPQVDSLTKAGPAPPCYPKDRPEKDNSTSLYRSNVFAATGHNSWSSSQTGWWPNVHSTSVTNFRSENIPIPIEAGSSTHDVGWWKCADSGASSQRHLEDQHTTQKTNLGHSLNISGCITPQNSAQLRSESDVFRPVIIKHPDPTSIPPRACSEDDWRRRISEATGLTDGLRTSNSTRNYNFLAESSTQHLSASSKHVIQSVSSDPNIVTSGSYLLAPSNSLRPHLSLPSSGVCPTQGRLGMEHQYSPVTPASAGVTQPMESGDQTNTAFAFPPSEHHLQSLSTRLGGSYPRSMCMSSQALPTDNNFHYQGATTVANQSLPVGPLPPHCKTHHDGIAAHPPQRQMMRHSSSIPHLSKLEHSWPGPPMTNSDPGPAGNTSFDGRQKLTSTASVAFPPRIPLASSGVEPMGPNSSGSFRLCSSIPSGPAGDTKPQQSSFPSYAHHTLSKLSARPVLSTLERANPVQPVPSQQMIYTYTSSSQPDDELSCYPRRQSFQPYPPTAEFMSHSRAPITESHASLSHPVPGGRHSFQVDNSRQVPMMSNEVQGQSRRFTNCGMNPSPDHQTTVSTSRHFPLPLEPERTRHISAPMVQPCPDYALSSSHASVRLTTSYSMSSNAIPFSTSGSSLKPMFVSFAGPDQATRGAPASPDLAASDAVADLLMQSHITDPQNVAGGNSYYGGVCSSSIHTPLHIDAEYANQIGRNSNTITTPISNISIGSEPHKIMDTLHLSGNISATSGPTSSCDNTGDVPLAGPECFELADLANGSGSADESDNSAVTRLSKSLAEENLFRNPRTLPLPKKFKRKPAPIFIPPQTSANLSRLRSPRVWTSECSSMGASPPPYTPPPMLSPNRRGSGLFSSLTRWSSINSPQALSRRNSSYYPASATGDYFRRRSAWTPSSAHGTTCESEGALKRSYPTGVSCATSSQTISCTVESRDNLERRTYAYPRRRRQLTPKSAPMILLDSSNTEPVPWNTDATAPQHPIQQSSRTVFGYDDETMRRFAEADAAERARRLGRRRCETETNNRLAASNVTIDSARQDLIPEKLSKLEQSCDTLMNYKPEEALELVQDTLAGLDEEMQASDVYIDEEEDLDEEEEEGLPSSLIPRINIGDAFQAEIPDYCPDRTALETESRETLLWYPANLDDRDPKNIESLNLLMKIACSPAVRSSGLNMEYTFHLLCKYKGNLEMTLHALLYETLVVYDYVYAETTAWTTDEISRFQYGLRLYGRDFHQVSKDLQANGMNKTVKACVEFYYVWKRMNTPSDVKWYREKARKQRHTRNDPSDIADIDVHLSDTTKSVNNFSSNDAERSGLSAYNLRRKPASTKAEEGTPDLSVDITQLDDFASLGLDSLPVYDNSSGPTDLGLLAQMEEELNVGSTGDSGFPCHICHRVFAKVKSRNAHMKSHSERSGPTPPLQHRHPISFAN